MTDIAVLYGTTEGQTAKIAQHIAARLRNAGHNADPLHVAELPDDFDLSRCRGVVIGASIHEGNHQRYVLRWIKQHLAALQQRPTAWFSVCLAINSQDPDERAEATAFPARMTDKTGLEPTLTTTFAGALKYTQYSWLKRIVMKQISRREGGSTDTTQDHEYTDWTAVDAFTDRFTDLVGKPT